MKRSKTLCLLPELGNIRLTTSAAGKLLGEVQFRPLRESKPFLGEAGKLEKIAEYKVEMICKDSIIKIAVQCLLDVHPYQEPAYEIYPIFTLENLTGL